MILLKLAFKNITHAGIRIWLNVIVLSIAFVTIVLTEGIYVGMESQVRDAEVESNYGGGQFWQKNYDPYDFFSIENSHAPIPAELRTRINNGDATAILIASASIFPNHQIRSALLKGIDPDQNIINLPSSCLNISIDKNSVPGFVGQRMAESLGINEGDIVSVRWRNINGTFDTGDIKIIKIINISVPSIDREQIWISLDKLQAMMNAPDQATTITLKKDITNIPSLNSDWIFQSNDVLLKDLNDNIARKKIYTTIMYCILMAMALLAVFDTQVLSIFKRRKEIGTMMALGMTRWNVIVLFILEGSITGIIAFFAGCLYGFPLFNYLAKNGFDLPKIFQQSQFAVGFTLYPKYGILLYFSTALILFITVLIVSFLSSRRISNLKPTDALKGKLT